MSGTDGSAPGWVQRICTSDGHSIRAGGQTLRVSLAGEGVDLSDRETFVPLVRSYLGGHPGVVERWQVQSYDKRSSPSPYLDGTEVGFFSDGHKTNVRMFEDRLDACAEYIYQEVAWILERRVVG